MLERLAARRLHGTRAEPSRGNAVIQAWHVTDQTVSPTLVTGGIGFYEGGNEGINRQFAAKAEHEQIKSHELGFGLGSTTTSTTAR